MATCNPCSTGGGGGGDDDGWENWERRRRENVEANRRAIAEIVEQAKKEFTQAWKNKKGVAKRKKSKKGDQPYYSQGRPTQPRPGRPRRAEPVDYRKLAGEGEEEEEEEERK